MKVIIVSPDAMVNTTSYCRILKSGKEQPVEYYEIADAKEVDLDKLVKNYMVDLGYDDFVMFKSFTNFMLAKLRWK